MDASPLTDTSSSDVSPELGDSIQRFPDPPHVQQQQQGEKAARASELVRTWPAEPEAAGLDGKEQDRTSDALPTASASFPPSNIEIAETQRPLAQAGTLDRAGSMQGLGLDVELDAMDLGSSAFHRRQTENGIEEALKIQSAGQHKEEGTKPVGPEVQPFSFASTPSSPMQVLASPSMSRSNSAKLSTKSSTSSDTSSVRAAATSTTSGSVSHHPEGSPSPDGKVKRRTSLLGVLGGLGKSNSRKDKPRLGGSGMSSISESDSVSDDAASLQATSASRGSGASPQKSLTASRQSSLRRAHEGPSDYCTPSASSSASASSSGSIPPSGQVAKKLTRPYATASAASSSSVGAATSLKSIPPFPISREHLQPFKQRAEFLMKFSAFGWRQLSKHGAWRPRFILLSAVPALKPAADVPLGGHHFILSAFKTNDMRDVELERIRLTKNTVICVTDEVGGGKLYVLKISDAVCSTASNEPWFFSLNDVSDLTVWLRLLKSLVLQLRGVKPAQASEPSAEASSLSKPTSSSMQRSRSTDLASELEAQEHQGRTAEQYGHFAHPFASSSLHSGQHLPAPHVSQGHQRRRNLSQDSAASSPSWAHHPGSFPWASSDDLDPEIRNLRRLSSDGNAPTDEDSPPLIISNANARKTPHSSHGLPSTAQGLSLSVSAASPPKSQAPTAPLPPLPPAARQLNPRLSVYSQSSDETAHSFGGGSSLASSRRISASSGGSLTSPGSSLAGRSMHSKGSEPSPPVPPVRSPFRNATTSLGTSEHFASQSLPPLPPATPSGQHFQPTRLASPLPEHQEAQVSSNSSLSLLDEVAMQEGAEQEAQLNAFNLSQELPPELEERRPQIRFDDM